MGRPARDKTSALVTLSCQHTADASQVECVEPFLLPGICSPRLAAIQQCADNTGIVDCHICLHRQLGACPHSSCETGESLSCLSNHLVGLCVQREVVSDGGAEVGELADSIEFIVVDGNEGRGGRVGREGRGGRGGEGGR